MLSKLLHCASVLCVGEWEKGHTTEHAINVEMEERDGGKKKRKEVR